MTPFDFDEWALYGYNLPLHKPIAARGASAYQRKGLVVFYRNSWGVGLGEAAPIADFHPIGWEETREEIHSALENPSLIHDIHPISRCAIEMATHQHVHTGSVHLNGLLTDTTSFDPQFGCYKIKVGRNSVGEDITMMHTLSRIIPPHTPIRLDANCAWSVEECTTFWKGISALNLNIEYIEEPLRTPEFYAQLEIPFALDENLSAFAETWHHLPFLRAIILKPSLQGYYACWEWMHQAQQHNIKAVVSSTFESSIGLWGYTQLALLQPHTHAGLATGNWFAEDTLVQRATPQHGLLSVPSTYALNSNMDWEKV